MKVSSKRAVRTLLCIGAALIGGYATAQQLKEIARPRQPLVLEQQGSFFVGGRVDKHVITNLGSLNRQFDNSFHTGDVIVDQMYVQFQKPPKSARHVPIVFIHGCCLSAKTWETTPDGRMGWYEYFTRKGYATYLVDQVGRGRSGFDGAHFNLTRSGGALPDRQPPIIRASMDFVWQNFRFGPRYGEAWPDGQFPTDHVDELFKQMIPDLIATETVNFPKALFDPSADHPTIRNLSLLSRDLDGAVLVGHSQSSFFPTQAALREDAKVRGIVQLETGCFDNLTPRQIAVLAKIPILILVGDHWPMPQPIPACEKERAQIEAAGGDFTFLSLPDRGLRGNSHMLMQDRNNLQVADIILDWIAEHVDKKAR